MGEYLGNYLRAIDDPPDLLRDAFDAEFQFLFKHLSNGIVLDVGCGVGRPADKVAIGKYSLIGLDNDPDMLTIAQVRCEEVGNLEFVLSDALALPFGDSTFDSVYYSYNTVGSVSRVNRSNFLSEQVRVVKPESKVVNITWNIGPKVTRFLSDYYANIGLSVESIDDSAAVTSGGCFYRFRPDDLRLAHEKAGLVNVHSYEVGPLWYAVVGEKPSP